MLGDLRKPLFVAALILIALVFLFEIGAGLFVGVSASGDLQSQDLPRPGFGLSGLAFMDGLLLYTVILMGSSLLLPESFQSKAQGIVTLIVSVLTLIGAVVMILATIAVLFLMIALLMAIPFGTIIYMIGFADFDTTGARVALGAIMSLKMAFAICLVLAHQRFLQNKGLVLMIVCSFIGSLVISFLHGLVPGFLVSITDAIAAIVVLIIAVIWAVFLLIGSIPAIINALRVDRALS